MALTEKQLLSLKKDIEQNKQQIERLKGEEIALLKRLKQEYACDTLEDAEDKLKELREDEEKLNQDIQNLTDAIEDKYLEEE